MDFIHDEDTELELPMTLQGLLEYEITGSWWAGFIWWQWGIDLSSAYFAWKVKTKYNRWVDFNRIRTAIK